MCLELFTGTETKLYRMTNIHTIKCSYLPKQCSHIQTALWELFLAHISSPAMPSISLEKANLADVKTIQENTQTVQALTLQHQCLGTLSGMGYLTGTDRNETFILPNRWFSWDKKAILLFNFFSTEIEYVSPPTCTPW